MHNVSLLFYPYLFLTFVLPFMAALPGKQSDVSCRANLLHAGNGMNE